jgi:3-hydroxyisobutyrate dehydrogenase-like beta-hydroxyacid dehydrogenase
MNLKVLFVGKGIITKELYGLLKPIPQYDTWIYRRNSSNEVDPQITDDINQALDNATVIISCVPNDNASKSFWHNQDVVNYLINKQPVCIEMSTLSYNFARELYEYFKEIKCRFIEMPFTGSKKGARTGKLSLFIKSNFVLSAEIESFLDVISTKKYIFHEAGKPTLFKLFYNIWGFCYLYFLSEFGPIIEECFQDESDVIEILKTDGWMSGVCQGKLDNFLNNDYSNTAFPLKHAVKDIDYALDVFSKFKMPVTKRIAEIYHSIMSTKIENSDFSIICGIYREHHE